MNFLLKRMKIFNKMDFKLLLKNQNIKYWYTKRNDNSCIVSVLSTNKSLCVSIPAPILYDHEDLEQTISEYLCHRLGIIDTNYNKILQAYCKKMGIIAPSINMFIEKDVVVCEMTLYGLSLSSSNQIEIEDTEGGCIIFGRGNHYYDAVNDASKKLCDALEISTVYCESVPFEHLFKDLSYRFYGSSIVLCEISYLDETYYGVSDTDISAKETAMRCMCRLLKLIDTRNTVLYEKMLKQFLEKFDSPFNLNYIIDQDDVMSTCQLTVTTSASSGSRNGIQVFYAHSENIVDVVRNVSKIAFDKIYE